MVTNRTDKAPALWWTARNILRIGRTVMKGKENHKHV